MPVSLLPHILDQPIADGCIRCLKPSPEAAQIITGFLVVPPAAVVSEAMAFSDGMPTLVFTGAGKKIRFSGVGGSYQLDSAWMNSPYLEQARILQEPGAELFVVRFHPHSFYQLFDRAAPGYGDRDCRGLPEALGPGGALLLKSVQQAGSVRAKIAAVEAFVITRCKAAGQPNAMLERALIKIRQLKGHISVQELSQQLRVSSKWLERHFLSSLGLSPKEYIRLQRFLHAFAALSLHRNNDLGSLALAYGYYDQNHFTREFRRFAGKAPLQYLESLKPGLRDASI